MGEGPEAADYARTVKTAARYLGLRGQAASQPDMEALLQKAYGLLRQAARPRHRLVRCDVALPQDGIVRIGPMPPVESRSLWQLLKGCTEGYAILATLGMEVDLAARRAMVTDAALGAAIGACGSAYIDVYLDQVLGREAAALTREGRGLTPRFSPGYGDAPLAMQPALLALCGARHMGVRLTGGNLMLPEKSVSAVMGITDMPGKACPQGCGACPQKECEFREEET